MLGNVGDREGITMPEIVTCDLTAFGYREIDMAIELLKAYNDNKRSIDIGDGLKLCFNTHSGCVFLTDEDYRLYMINNETEDLEEWHNCPICGCEGFKDYVTDIDNHTEQDKECKEWIKELEER